MTRPRPSRGGVARRQQILDVAAELFAARGFYGVTVDDLGAAVGVSGPALYHHFDSKEVLLGEMLVSISEYLLGGGHRAVATAASPSAALDALLAFHIDFALDRTSLITVHVRELVHAPDAQLKRIRSLQTEYAEMWVDVLLELNPALDRKLARSATHAVFGLLNSTPHSARAGREAMVQLLFRMGRAAFADIASFGDVGPDAERPALGAQPASG